MAKRQFDTKKFEDPWYRSLPPRAKLLWEYMLCACDCAGVWKADFGIASFCIGIKVSSTDIDEFFTDRCAVLTNGSIFIPKFLEFQYTGMDLLNLKNGVARGVQRALQHNHLNYPECLKLDTLSNRVSDKVSDSQSIPYGIGDKDKDKDKVKVKESYIDNKGSHLDSHIISTFDLLWRQYPNKQGRKDAIRHYKASVKTEDQITSIKTALENYLGHVADKEPQYIKNGSTWFNQWEDWIENPVTDYKKDRVESQKERERNQKLQKMGLT